MPSGPNFDDFLCFAVYSTESAFHRVYRPLLEPLGLTYAQYLVLAVLWQRDRQTVGQIGERLYLDSSTLSPLLKRLEAMGHVRRHRSSSDERVVEVELTDRGSALRQSAAPIPHRIAEAAGMSLDELRRIKSDVERLRNALHQWCREA